MTIDEAIKFQEVYLRSPMCNLSGYEKEAIKLGIQALERIQDIRKDGYPRDLYSLPGETKD